MRPGSIEELEQTVIRGSPAIMRERGDAKAKARRDAVIRTLVREFEGKNITRERLNKVEEKKSGRSKEKAVNKSLETRAVVNNQDLSFHHRPKSS